MKSFTGGARFGWANATWPFAQLTVREDNLKIGAAIIGAHSFTPEQVVAIRSVTWIPFLARGVQIVHTRGDIPQSILFWCWGSPQTIVRQIAEVGFVAKASPGDQPEHTGFPVRIGFLVAVFLLWNGLILWDRPWERLDGSRGMDLADIGPGTLIALTLAVVGSIAIRRPGILQRLALRDPEGLSKIRAPLNVITFVLLVMLVVIGASFATN